MPSTIFTVFLLDPYNNPVKMAILKLSFQTWGHECPAAGGVRERSVPRTTQPAEELKRAVRPKPSLSEPRVRDRLRHTASHPRVPFSALGQALALCEHTLIPCLRE